VKEVQNMTARSYILSIAGLAIVGSLGFGNTGASAQALYVDPYVDPYVESYPVVVAPGTAYVARPYVVAPRPIVRERTVVVSRPAFVPAPVFGAPVPAYGYDDYDYVGGVGYAVPGW
jgi:hypothetical protein